MQNVVLILHLIIAICLIATVLLQRSEGGALGIGGGGGGGVNARPRVTPVAKLTWGLADGVPRDLDHARDHGRRRSGRAVADR